MRSGEMSAIWQFIRKHEIWFLIAVFVGIFIVYEITEDVLWAKLGILVGITAMVRIGMLSIWKNHEQAE